MNAITAAVSHEKLQGLGKQHLQGMVRKWCNPSLVKNPSQALFEGIGLHPGTVTGYLIFQPENIAHLRSVFGQDMVRLPVIYGVDEGDCNDLEPLSFSKALLSSNASPNAWCAVQAKSEGLPSVIGVQASFSSPGGKLSKRNVDFSFSDGRQIQATIHARTVEIEGPNGLVRMTEGDLVTLDGNSGMIYAGLIGAITPAAKEIHSMLTDIMVVAIEQFGPVQAWKRFRETPLYQQYRPRLVYLAKDDEFKVFQQALKAARQLTPIRVMATAHTVDGTVQTRLAFADIEADEHGDIAFTLHDQLTGIGLLRTERYYRRNEELDALRVLMLGRGSIDKSNFEKAKNLIMRFETDCTRDIFIANSGCPTVVRLLCMPFNKLFPDGLDIAALSESYRLDAQKVEKQIRETLRESETFHGCRGARLHMLRLDLLRLQAEAVLRAADEAIRLGADVQLTILVAMVTFPEEINIHIEIFDETYGKLLKEGLRLPETGLAIMVETSAAYHSIEKFLNKKGRYIEFRGALVGGNDFTAATLNLNRHDATRAIIPHYVKSGILPSNPFLTLHSDTVGSTICSLLRRMRTASRNGPLTIGFGGEQAGDWQTVSWLSTHAAPEGLSYVSTSPDRLLDALFAAADAKLHSTQEGEGHA